MNCTNCQKALPDLLFDPAAPASVAVRAHIATCSACAQELASFEATVSLLDTWEVPEVSPYFDQRLAVRLREEQAAPAAGWFEKLRTRLLFNTGRQFRPALAGAMALLLILGGGGIGVTTLMHPRHVPLSATLNDLQILDNNEQALQQEDQVLQDDGAADSGTPQS